MASARLVLPWLFPAWMTTSPASRSSVRGSVPKALNPRISSDTNRVAVVAWLMAAARWR